ncbi:SOS response-associated peptidase [Mycoplasmatota bacterium]|nr:SOS response-associated peptidase [Mycoplasmatota bacterium]
MCGRISVALSTEDMIQVLRERYDIDEENIDFELPRYNVAPSTKVLSVISDGKKYRVGSLRWGFIPFWAKDEKFYSINAKAETISSKPMFKDSFKHKRCVILADGFYEWKKENKNKIPYHFKVTDQSILPLAGLWSAYTKEDGSNIYTCTVITTEPNEIMKPIHDRMPVILTLETEKTWLNPLISDVDILESLLVPYQSINMDCFKVNPIVNNPRNETSDCLKSIV